MQKPSIYAYLDYRNFLKDISKFFQASEGVSTRELARRAGIRSSGFLSMTMNGKRNLDKARAIDLGLALQLNRQEIKFFQNLIAFTDAETVEEKDLQFKSLRRIEGFRKIRRLEADQYDYFSKWFYVAVYEAIGTSHAGRGVLGIAAALGISEKQVREACDLLVKLGLLKMDGKKLKRLDVAVQTPAKMRSLNVRNFHREMILRSLHALDNPAGEERSIEALSIPLSKKSFHEVQKRVHQFVKEINLIYSEDRAATREVCQLNVQFFALTGAKK